MYTPPLFVRRIFPSFIWNSKTEKILITFDDGPTSETTDAILKVLSDNSIKAVFFCVGNQISKSFSLLNSIIEEGHTIGNHTYNHKLIDKMDKKQIHDGIESVNRLLSDRINYDVKYFRPPYGRFDFRMKRVLQELDMTNVMWSLLTFDYKNDINIVKFAVTKYLTRNSIIVLHDSIKSSNVVTDSIKFILEETSKKGYEIGDPSECLK